MVVTFDGESQLYVLTTADRAWKWSNCYSVDVRTGSATELWKSERNVTALSRDGMTLAKHQSSKTAFATDAPPEVPIETIAPIQIIAWDDRSVAESISCDIVIERMFLFSRDNRFAALFEQDEVTMDSGT